MNMIEILLLILLGVIAGILSGFLGIGGAVIVVPALIFIFGFSQHNAQGTSLGFLLAPIGIFAFLNYYKHGYVNVKYAIIIAAAFMLGAYFGSKIAINVSGDMLRKIFAAFIILIGIRMLFK